jgi:CHAT domain-containing protein
VPAYYRALQAQADSGEALDPGAALHAAQRALQRSRAFRHPFHWGAWVHLQRLPLIRATAPGHALPNASP